MTDTPLIPHTLVVDDEVFMRKLVAAQLRSLGCKAVLCMASGKDALDALAQARRDISLILCDLQMPGMDGVEFIRRLGGMGYQGALILISGEDPRTMSMATKLACEHGLHVLGALSKPIQTTQLQALLGTLGDPPAMLPEAAAQAWPVAPSDLAEAIDAGQLLNHYQPKVCLRTGRVVGMESLVRWQHPVKGLVYPEAFISVAEDHGLIDRLTQKVMTGPQGALTHLRQWRDAGAPLHLAVNVSMDNLHDLGFPDFVAQAAREAGVGLGQVIMEITESRFNTDVRAVTDVLTRLRLRRARLSIDDFGTGYSSLSQLHDLPFDELKIDRQFVHGAGTDAALNSILDASIKMARGLKISTVGEGVETWEDWQHLQQAGCDMAQGYWIAPPMAAEQVVPWLTEWASRIAANPELLHSECAAMDV